MKQSLVTILVIALLVVPSMVVALSPPAEPLKKCSDICGWQLANCEFNTLDSLAKKECKRSYEDCIKDNDKCSEFQINLGESQTIAGLTFYFKEIVEDSRCPPNADCVWKGRVVARIGITGTDCQNQQPLYLDVSTERLQEFQYSKEDQYKNVFYSLTLSNVEPENNAAKKEPYKVRLMLQKDTSSTWCDMPPCPPVVACESMKACTAEAKLCPDGSSVGRNPLKNCEFNPCPSENQCGICKREYDECMTQEMVGIEKVCEPKYKECLNKCQSLPVEPTCSNGCYNRGQCAPFGFRTEQVGYDTGVPVYCAITGTFLQQKADGSDAQNSYECLSNFQSDGKCVSVSENLNILQKIIKWFSRIFGGN